MSFKLQSLLEDFKNATSRLDDVLQQKKDEYIRDSAIQRFEFTFDISWKTVKAFLEEKKGVVCASPKDCFREAYKQGLVEYDDFWITITDTRNKTVHTYNEAVAEEVYGFLPQALIYFKKLLEYLTVQSQN